jgi:hypothetical protein
MANKSPYLDSDGNTGDDSPLTPEHGSPPSTPRWVRVFGVIVVAAALLFLILHLAGHRHGGHALSL